MLGRVLLLVLLTGLALGGAASASLLSTKGGKAVIGATTTTPCGGTTTVGAPTTIYTTVGTTTTSTLPVTTTGTTTGLTTTTAPVTTTPVTSTSTLPCTTGTTSTSKAATTGTTSSTTTIPAVGTAIVTSSAASTLVLTGHGWGHGMGMSQWGADGFARHGWTATQILEHYYTGTTVTAEPSTRIRVLLDSGRKTATLSSSDPWTVVDANGTTVALPAGKLVVPASLVVSGQTLASPLTFSPGPTPLSYGSTPYRGSLVVSSTGTTVQVVNTLDLEQYVDGVVGAEMPSTWPAAALQTQAVAARSYALAEIENVVTARSFDVYSDSRDQEYGGIHAESPAVTAAVTATAHQVVLYKGKVITAYFSASSGGRTVSYAEANGGQVVPYLQSVDDPYDTISPYHDWGPVLFNATKVAKAIAVPGQLVSFQLTPGPSEHIQSMVAVGTKGSITLTGPQLRADLGLRSTWFAIGWLALDKPTAAVTAGQPVSLTGLARGVTAVTLEQKTVTGWQTVQAIAPAADGSFTVVLHPSITTTYRLAAGDVRAATVKVPVVPVVTAATAGGTVTGTSTPAFSGAAVQVQRQNGHVWTTVATGTTTATGSFSVVAQLAPGVYRVRCAPGHGLSPGVSATFEGP